MQNPQSLGSNVQHGNRGKAVGGGVAATTGGIVAGRTPPRMGDNARSPPSAKKPIPFSIEVTLCVRVRVRGSVGGYVVYLGDVFVFVVMCFVTQTRTCTR